MVQEFPSTTLDRFGINRETALKLSGSYIFLHTQVGEVKGGGFVPAAHGDVDHRMEFALVGFWTIEEIVCSVSFTSRVEKAVHDGVKATLSTVQRAHMASTKKLQSERDYMEGAFRGVIEALNTPVSSDKLRTRQATPGHLLGVDRTAD